MSDRMYWRDYVHLDEPLSPFTQGPSQRKFRLTFHDQSLSGAAGDEGRALEVLRGLAHIADVDVVLTSPGQWPHITLLISPYTDSPLPFTIGAGENASWHAGHGSPLSLLEAVKEVCKTSNLPVPTISDDCGLLFAAAHANADRDVFVTMDSVVLASRRLDPLRRANARTPIEAVKILGLFLRARKNWTYRAGAEFTALTGRSGFYWYLVRHNLPNCWAYFSHLVAAQRSELADLIELGGSFFDRLGRAAQAVDAIGVQHYQAATAETADEALYHFDYFNLLITGAIDAQARVAKHAYKLNIKDYEVSFAKSRFLKELASVDAKDLVDLAQAPEFVAFWRIVREVRNTVHATGIQSASRTGYPEQSIAVKIPDERTASLKAELAKVGGPSSWGISGTPPITVLHADGSSEIEPERFFVDPYSYARKVFVDALKFVDLIAKATDTSGLLSSPSKPTNLIRDEPPDFKEKGELFSMLF